MRAIALDIETAPSPEALERLAADPPDLRPQDAAGVCRILTDHLAGVGDKSAPAILQALGGVPAFYELVDGNASAVMRARCLAVDGLVKGKIKATEAEFQGIIASISGGMDAWYAELTKKCSLDPYLCRVVSVALAGEGGEGGVLHLGEYGEAVDPPGPRSPFGGRRIGDEEALLRDLWSWLEDHFAGQPVPVLVTFNGLAFDAWVLVIRSLLLGVAVPWVLTEQRHSSYAPVCDLYQWLTRWGKATGEKGTNSLLASCQRWGIPHPAKERGMDGSQVAQLVEELRWEELAAYNLDDARATWALFQRLRSQIPGMADGAHAPGLARSSNSNRDAAGQAA